MALIKSFRGVLVEKTERSFEDGDGALHSGFYCTIVLEDGKLHSFWCDEGKAQDLGEAYDLEEFEAKKSRIFPLRAKEWAGRTKWSLV